MTLEQRVRKLERENRWMRRIAAVAVSAVAVVVLVGQGKKKKPQDLVVRSLTVVDENGKTQVEVGTAGGGGMPRLALCDRAGQTRVALMLDTNIEDSPSLVLRDKAGTVRFEVSMPEHFSGSPSLILSDRAGKDRARLHTFPDGSPSLLLYDKDENRAVLCTVWDGKPSFSLRDPKGNVTWQAPR